MGYVLLLPEYKGVVLLPEQSCFVGFIANAKFEILTALLLTIQVCLYLYCIIGWAVADILMEQSCAS